MNFPFDLFAVPVTAASICITGAFIFYRLRGPGGPTLDGMLPPSTIANTFRGGFETNRFRIETRSLPLFVRVNSVDVFLSFLFSFFSIIVLLFRITLLRLSTRIPRSKAR